MRPNGFKAALGSRQTLLGVVAGMGESYCADILGGSPFDWVLIDGEHSPCDTRTVLHQLQALAAHRREAAFRSATLTPANVTQWLDIGVQTLVAPMIENAPQAAALVAATRYPPDGHRGVGSALSRAAEWGRCADYLSRANAQICVVAQIESPAGLADVEAIAATQGIDAILIGPSDLAARMGHPGHSGHPAVQDAIDQIIHRTRASGKPVGTFVSEPTDAQRYASLGCSFMIVGSDTRIFAKALDDTAAAFRKAVSA
jgi:4-hydroxy-2-oxoheptanedioate aldolase